ncbi:hypothetical protein MED152_10805 [Polaribacter sp. MED152]|nr:hypothetical protein MED152_10805 [Polaribacter sp. MED152]
MELFQDSLLYVELISLLLTLLFLKSYKSKQYCFFIAYLLFAVLADFLGGLINEGSDAWLYNIYTFFEYGSVALIYYYATNTKLSKKVIVYTSIFFYTIYGLSFVFTSWQTYTVILLHFCVVPFFFFYFQELLNSKKIMNYKKQLFFWVTVGFLIYYFGNLPFITLSFIGMLQNRILYSVPTFILLIVHGIFIVNLIWLRKVRKLS